MFMNVVEIVLIWLCIESQYLWLFLLKQDKGPEQLQKWLQSSFELTVCLLWR